MAFIGEEELNNIKSNVDIIDLISRYVPLSQKGKNYFGVCPFHEDHSPSMSVSKEKQIYKCFSCGASGNIFTFVANYENVSFIEAVKIVADMANITIAGDFKAKKDVHQKEFDVMDLSLLFYKNNINSQNGIEAIKYLKSRGLTDQVIKDFEIGLASNKFDELTNLFDRKKIDLELAYNLSLLNKKDNRYFDMFRNRIMIPIHNISGQVVGYTGRIYDNSDTNRYMNSKENIIFKKGSILFNYHRAKDAVKMKHELVVVEGNFDAISLYNAGIKNVVALMGTALTKEQIDLFKKLHAKIILVLDNDDAGLEATYHIATTLYENNVDIGIVRISNAKDPDEYIKKIGVEEFQNNLKNNINFIDFKMHYLKRNMNLNKTEDLRNYINKILGSLKDSNDEILIELTLNKISEDYNIAYDLLKSEYLNLKNTKPKENIVVENTKKDTSKESKYDNLIKNILYYMINDYMYVKAFKAKLGYIKTKKYRDLSNDIIYYAEKYKNINMSDFLSYYLLNNGSEDLINDVISVNNENSDELDEDLFNTYIELVKKEITKESINELKLKMKTELDENEKLEILKKITELKKGSV